MIYGEKQSHRVPAAIAVDHFSWRAVKDTGLLTLVDLEEAILRARSEGVPSDANIQMVDGCSVHFHWRRSAV